MDIVVNEESPEGTEIKVYHSQDHNIRRDQLSNLIDDLVNNQKIKEEQIVILGNHQLAHTSIGKNTQVGKFSIKENGLASKGVIPYYSCMKYKGLESDIVILLDYEDDRWQNKVVRYTAISRAKHLLYILDKSNSN